MQIATTLVQEQEAPPGPGDPGAWGRSFEASLECSAEAARSHAHGALQRVLPALQRYGLGLIPEHRSGRLSLSGEDLVQFAALQVLARLEAVLRAGDPVAAWWRTDARLEKYMRGIMRRRLKRVLRDLRELPAPVTPELVVSTGEPAPLMRRAERRRLRECLSGVPRRELRLYARFGGGRSYEELAPGIRISAEALAKRRSRALAELRERCWSCALRRQHGCAWIPRGWLVPS